VLRQGATRRFADSPVGDDLVERCIEAATHAPSAQNKQPWEFIVVRDPARRAAIGELTRTAWREGGRAQSIGRLPPRLLAEVDEGAEGSIAAAPVLIVACGNTELGTASTLPASIFPAVQNLLLAAGALGLGSALTTLALRNADGLQPLLDIPPHVVPMAIVPLGWPASPQGPPRRLPVAERTYRERYGDRW
jgi:nitroreductase